MAAFNFNSLQIQGTTINNIMDSNFLGTMLDRVTCGKLSMEEKRELVYELLKHPNGTPEMLLSWSRQEILQLLCAEMGKERKYTGLTKLKIIENLLKIVSEKMTAQQMPDSVDNQTPKSPRKPDHSSLSMSNGSVDFARVVYCKNSACKASLSQQDVFCKRCSCCICRKFDDNKDPSLWLNCSSDPPFEGESCNMSCHLECAMRHDRSGLSKIGQVSQLDGSFYCVSCGKMNDLLKCWKKQLMIARDTRRVDILCYRVYLSQKLLSGTNKYRNLSDIVDEAVSKLQAEVGTLTDITVKMGRGIVNRMSAGQQVQRLCASAVELLDSMLPEVPTQILARNVDQVSRASAVNTFRFEDISDTSVTVILGPANQTSELNVRYRLWHHKAVDEEETCEQTCTLSPPGTRVIVQGLAPSTEYVFKVVSFEGFQETGTHEARVSTSALIVPKTTPENSHSPVTTCSTLSNPSSVEDEMNNSASGLIENNKVDNHFTFYKNSMDGPINRVGGIIQDGVSASNGKHAPNDVVSDQSGVVKLESKHTQEHRVNEESGLNTPIKTRLEIVPCLPPETELPTPCRIDILGTVRRNRRSRSSKKYAGDTFRNGGDQPRPSSSSKKRCRESKDEDGCEGNADLEFHVKVIRKLECEGHIEKSFRQKFVTWYSLRATPREMHVVQVFINALRDDPSSLAEQLVDAFEEIVSGKCSEALIPSGFCMKLWH